MCHVFLMQDNLWKTSLNTINQEATRAFDMVFIIGQKPYEGYEYYDFFEQVFERLKRHPFRSNLTSEREVSTPSVFWRKKKLQMRIFLYISF